MANEDNQPNDQPGNNPIGGKEEKNQTSLGASAAEGLVGKTTRHIKVAAKNAGKEKDKTGVIIAILIVVVVVGVASVAMLDKHRSEASTQATTVVPRIDVGMSGQEQVRAFTRKTAQEVTELSSSVARLEKVVDTLVKRQDSSEQAMREALQKAVNDFEKKSTEQLRLVDEYVKTVKPTGTQSQEADRYKMVLDEFRTSLTNLKVSPAEARARAMQALRESGMSEASIKDALAQTAEKAGRITLGDVAEPPISDAERKSVPDWAVNRLEGIKNLIYGAAYAEGRLFPEQNIREVKGHLLAQEPRKKAEITDELVAKVTNICRVRRENLRPEQEDVLPYFVAMRDEKKINKEDRYSIAAMIFSDREKIPGEPTPGQMLTMTHAAMRAISATTKTQDAGAFKDLDEAGVQYASEVVASAVAGAVQLGRNQSQQYEIGMRSLDNYLDTARYRATADQKKSIITRVVAKASKAIVDSVGSVNALQGGDGRVDSAQRGESAKSSPKSNDEDYLFFGPLKIERGKGLRALVFAVPGLLNASGLDPASDRGAIAAVTAWEQSARLAPESIRRYAGKAGGGRAFMAEIVPEIMTQAGTASDLNGIKFQVAGGNENRESSPQAKIMRGVTLGAIFGPVNHENMEKATAVAGEAMAAVSKQAPLTAELSARMNPDRPYEAIIIAYDVLRPGRLSYSGARYQDIVQRMAAQAETIATLRQMISREAGDQIAGEFDEAIRLLLPMAVANRDDTRIETSVVMAGVRNDLIRFTAQYLAEVIASRAVTGHLLPKYAAAVGMDGSGDLVAQAAAHTSKAIQDRFTGRGDINSEDVIPTAYAVVGEATPEIERCVVQNVVLSRITPRLRQLGFSGEQLTASIRQAEERVASLVKPAYTPARMDGWASQVTDEIRRGIVGNAGTSASSQPDVQGNPRSRSGGGLWVTPTIIKPLGGQGHLVGTTTTLVTTRKLVIPAGSFANGHILSAVDAEVGGRNNIPVMAQVSFAWEGPAGSRVVMRDARLLGSASAMAGPERVAIDLKRLSYVLFSGREVSSDINGYVSDNVLGQYGALGHWKWNAEKVLPLAVIAGGFQGAGDALKANSTAQIVTLGATTTTSTASAGEQALYGGMAGGFGIMSDYVKGVLEDVRPSVSMANGQRVSVVLIDPVVLDVTEDEYRAVFTPSGGFAP